MYSHTEENYLKTIFQLLEENKEPVTTNAIAKILETKAASVSDMLRKLSQKKLVNYKKYNGVTLSASGEKAAVSVIRKHRLWEMFLVEKLNFKWDEVHEVAEQLEHIQSEKLIHHIEKFLNFPKFDPHGDPIPDEHGKIPEKTSVRLCDLTINEKGIVTGVADHSDHFLRYLDSTGLSLGNEIIIKKIQDYDRAICISTKRKKNLFISPEMSKKILVDNKQENRKNVR